MLSRSPTKSADIVSAWKAWTPHDSCATDPLVLTARTSVQSSSAAMAFMARLVALLVKDEDPYRGARCAMKLPPTASKPERFELHEKRGSRASSKLLREFLGCRSPMSTVR